MKDTIKISTGNRAVTVSVGEEALVKDGAVVIERHHTNHEVFVAPNREHVVFLNEHTTFISIQPVAEGSDGIKIYGPAD